jgi:hypothetical protein
MKNRSQLIDIHGGRPIGRRQLLGLATVGIGGVLLAACGTSAPATTAPATAVVAVPTTAATRAATAPVAATARATTTASAAKKVNANTASEAELLSAFQAANISNAARWVKEVMEYRPYPTNDPTFAKLRGELAKYNPGPGVVDQIVATLSLQ